MFLNKLCKIVQPFFIFIFLFFYNHDHEDDDDDNDVDDLLYLEKNWNDAQAACQVDGGNLVSVVNIFESAFIGTLVHRNYSYWIGLSDTTVI